VSRRARAWVALAVLIAYAGAILAGPRDWVIVTAFVVTAMPIVGILGWSLVGASLRDGASWTMPLLIWNGAIYVIRPPDLVAAAGFALGAIWLGAFFSWSPLVPWWYEHVLHQPEPIDPDAS
jgi:hypothetical protein